MFARAGEPKKLVVLKGFGHYEVYGGEAFRHRRNPRASDLLICLYESEK